MWFYLLLLFVPLLGVLAFFIAGPKGKNPYSWVQFYAKGKDAGFLLKEIDLLRKISVRAELEDPSSLFWSVKQLDLCIRAIIRKSRLTGDEKTLETQDFLSKLYEYRKKIEFEQPKYKKGITSSRFIAEGQRIRILVDTVGLFETTVLRNTDRFISIGKPFGAPQLPPSFDWKGRRLAIYFWRANDAGYVFDSFVLGEASMRSDAILQLAHSDSLFRTQKRRSVRTKKRISAFLYLPEIDEYPEKVESDPGMRCIIEDISEDGCALTIGGKAAVGLRVKMQLEINGETIAMSGVVKSSEYEEDTKRSLLHVELVPLSLAARNLILSEVFSVNPDDDLEAAFSVFDEEENMDFSNPDASGDEIEPVPKTGG